MSDKLEELADNYVGITDSDLHEGLTNKVIMEAYQRKKIFKKGYEIGCEQNRKENLDMVIGILKSLYKKEDSSRCIQQGSMVRLGSPEMVIYNNQCLDKAIDEIKKEFAKEV